MDQLIWYSYIVWSLFAHARDPISVHQFDGSLVSVWLPGIHHILSIYGTGKVDAAKQLGSMYAKSRCAKSHVFNTAIFELLVVWWENS